MSTWISLDGAGIQIGRESDVHLPLDRVATAMMKDRMMKRHQRPPDCLAIDPLSGSPVRRLDPSVDSEVAFRRRMEDDWLLGQLGIMG